MKRRSLLQSAILSLPIMTACASRGGNGNGMVSPARSRFRPFLRNPCREGLPEDLRHSPWLAQVWQGLEPQEVWDMHVHLAGVGDGDSGAQVGEKLLSPWHPVLYLQRLFYLNAGCVSGSPGSVDENYVRRLRALTQELKGAKLLLFAFDWPHDAHGAPQPEHSTFYVPDDYARQVAAVHPECFAWAASIHPHRPDALDRLEAAAAQGAKAVKWLPAAQNIDPAAPACDAFYRALARLDLPLISHCGSERAVQGAHFEHYGNPLRLRRALEAGVRVVVAHCASTGKDEDLDHPGKRCASFTLFARLMEEEAWRGRLFGDISALTLRNRKPGILRTLLERRDWHPRLLNGSDYPLPGILPIVSPAALAAHGFLPWEALADLLRLREYNALYFDLAVKRLLCWQGSTFSTQVFQTRAFFERNAP
ncbi:MAG: amidohydrolase family protein [Zoogloeaceae bacterium]|jgi:mannonate dehydratase|nr:amidohydrolase family protein [Zoogloeaceae bacterium]